MAYDTSMDTPRDDPQSRTRVVRVSEPAMNANAGMQIALTVLALAALPISAWLYIANYVETRVDTAINRQYEITLSNIRSQEERVDDMQNYLTQLCGKVRMMDSSFSCLSQNEIRYRYGRYPRDTDVE